MKKNSQLPGLSEVCGYSFTSPEVLQRALRRKAFCQEQGLSDDLHMDALATLGDAVIELQILTRLVQEGGTDKGEISVRKMDLVNMSVLRQAAEKIHLKEYVSWGNGEMRNHIWTSGRVLAECMEALIGAVFLDGGLDSSGHVMEKVGLFPESPGKNL
jgi:ribonuclease-3